MGSKNSLLKSVLNQNRDKEPIENNCDFTEILKPTYPIITNVSPKQQLNSSVEIIGDRASKKFNSPQSLAKEQQLLHQSSSHSKKKKYSSIIV
jgi:hypothetical protein